MRNSGPPSTVACAFPSTDWSAVARAAAGGEDPEARASLDRLLARYLPALRTFLVCERRIDRHRADDLLQGFVAERILEHNLLAEADRARGRFRSFLLTCLTRYASKQYRHDHAAKRHPGPGRLAGGLEGDDAAFVGDEQLAACDADTSEAFELAWARQVVADALHRMKEECEEMLRPDLWALFEGRVLLPATEGATPLDYAGLVERFAFESVAQATNALVTAKRMYARQLRAAVADYAEGDRAIVEDELRRLKHVLAGPTRR